MLARNFQTLSRSLMATNNLTTRHVRATTSPLLAAGRTCAPIMDPRASQQRLYTMKVAVEGCAHGELDAIYAELQRMEVERGVKADCLLIGGDFQAMRNSKDLNCMSAPKRYKVLGDFHKYYTGKATAPVLTIVVGGNHEASNYMWELYHGGWLAPNIYFLGHAGCVQLRLQGHAEPLRVAGVSGVHFAPHCVTGHPERLPYDGNALKSIYHTREYDIFRASLLSPSTLDVMMSHDWPKDIALHGDLGELMKGGGPFIGAVEDGSLGSPPLMGLLTKLKPRWWFSAHMHTRFEAAVQHDSPPAPASGTQETKFLALDKCVPGKHRPCLDIVDIPLQVDTDTSNLNSPRSPPVLCFDPDWLAIQRALHPWLSTSAEQRPLPSENDAQKLVEAEKRWVQENLLRNESQMLKINDVQKFTKTAFGPTRESEQEPGMLEQPPHYPNPQTAAFCKMLGIDNKIDAVYA